MSGSDDRLARGGRHDRLNAARDDTPARTPNLSLILAYGPALVAAAAGVAALLAFPYALGFGQLWTAAILIFLAGVTRGLSFFTQGGPRMTQVVVMLWRFACGLGALLLPPILALPLAGLGYLSALLYDPVAARDGGAPRYFAGLRPPQIALMLLGIALLGAAAVAD